MVKRKGLGQANILRTNNNTSTGYGVVYADEVSGHRTVGNLTALYALNDWQLSASGDNTDNDAIGQLWYVVNADGNGNGCYYQLKDWSKRKEAAGWSIADYTTKAELQNKVDNIATADEEDITVEGDTPHTQVLKLKDRTYDSLNASGKGYKILRKNWQQINGERKNVLTQDMINEPNTIYEIRYDFDLNGAEINIPEGCVLKFEGGSLSNGSIRFNNTKLLTSSNASIFIDVEPKGIIENKNKYSSWFTYSTESHDDWRLISTLLSSSGNVYLENKSYHIYKYNHPTETIKILSNTNIFGSNSSFQAGYMKDYNYLVVLFSVVKQENIRISNLTVNCELKGLSLPPKDHGSEKYPSSCLKVFSFGDYAKNITLENITILNGANGIKFEAETKEYINKTYFYNISIINCNLLCDTCILGFNLNNIIISNSYLENRETNNGNHPLYILPKYSDSTNINTITITDCYIHNVSGFALHIYDSLDKEVKDIKSICYVRNTRIESSTNNILTASASVRIDLEKCSLYSTKLNACYNSFGDIWFNNCDLTNVSFNANIRAVNCRIKSNNFILFDNGQTSPYSVYLDSCDIDLSTYFLYDSNDNLDLTVLNCQFKSTYEDGLLSQRQSQIKPISFYNCKFEVANRFWYFPKEVVSELFFINSTLNSKNRNINLYDDKAKIKLFNCLVNDFIINTSAKGTTTQRPTLSSTDEGFEYYDSTLKKKVLWNGTSWVNMDGTSLG